MGQVNHEPSMEDILASIKRIIADDGEPPQAGRVGRGDPSAAAGEAAPQPAEDILELTRPLDPAPATAANDPQTHATAASPSASTSTETEADMPEAKPAARDILSGATADVSRQALAALSALVVKPEQGENTLEGLVREMLRPMLREWLDAELPAIVERLVSGEIARISGRQG